MSIPLDRLYHYIESIAQDIRKDNVVIYRFWPHGSKKQEDLTRLKNYTVNEEILLPYIICHDQEPLNFDLYESAHGPLPQTVLERMSSTQPDRCNELYKIYSQITLDRHNLRYYPNNIYDHAILLHSELNSIEVEKYSTNGFIPVYYWSHAVIARDWFRYAKHIQQHKNIKKTFLIYNRAWSGTREYRLGFTDRLIGQGLENQCHMRISPIDSTLNKHYNLHNFESNWKPVHVLENYFPICDADSHASADFNLEDYESTNIEVVLETLFDDHRLHLTEKTLRPIALGQPFIFVGTPGSLKYLRDYGFKTFADCWDESYDTISDSTQRMNTIIEVMKNINSWGAEQRERNLLLAYEIAKYNQQHFFSVEFQQIIVNELSDNLTNALDKIEFLNSGKVWLTRRKQLLASSDFKKFIIKYKHDNQQARQRAASWTKIARQYKRRSLSNQ